MRRLTLVHEVAGGAARPGSTPYPYPLRPSPRRGRGRLPSARAIAGAAGGAGTTAVHPDDFAATLKRLGYVGDPTAAQLVYLAGLESFSAVAGIRIRTHGL